MPADRAAVRSREDRLDRLAVDGVGDFDAERCGGGGEGIHRVLIGRPCMSVRSKLCRAPIPLAIQGISMLGTSPGPWPRPEPMR